MQIPRFAELVPLFCRNIKKLTVDFPDMEESLVRQIVLANKLETLKVLSMFVRNFTSLLKGLMPSTDLKELEIHLGDGIEMDTDRENIHDFMVTIRQFFEQNQSLQTVKFFFTINTEIVRSILKNCRSLIHLELNTLRTLDLLSGAFDVSHAKLKTLIIHSKDRAIPDHLCQHILRSRFPALQTLEVAEFHEATSIRPPLI
ncbi:hypothetical protein ACOMHN_004002 [Nucella lapillus]